jgi:tetratricopeptide (TPR) repeat protein
MPHIIPAALLGVSFLLGCSHEPTETNLGVTTKARRTALDSAMKQLDAGRTVEALAITSKLVLRDPSSHEVLEKHAIVLLAEASRVDNNGEYELAIERREEALEAYVAACAHIGVAGETQFSAAQLAHMLGEIDLAQSLYKKTHQALPKDGRSALWLAQIELLNKNWNSANDWINESLLRQPLEPSALISAGLIQANLGNCKKGMQYTNKAVSLQPSDENFRLMQARVLRICHEPRRALELLSSLSLAMRTTDLVILEVKLCKAGLKEQQD